jgi:predicted transcriptional regulator
MSDLKKHLDEQLKDPEFAAEWERQRPESEYIKAIIAARMEKNLTQKELAEKTGIRQSNISRIENGNCSPTVATLQQIANGVGKTLHIEFK